MGYTHYWNPANLEIDEQLAAEAKAIVDASDVEIAGWDGEGEPEIGVGLVSLNGKGDERCETFSLQRDTEWNFECCKTCRQPYDAVVGAILLAADERNPGMDVTSDGFWDEAEWIAARELFAKALGRNPKAPAGMIEQYSIYRRETRAGEETMQAWLMCSGKVKESSSLGIGNTIEFDSLGEFEDWAREGGWEFVSN